MNKIKWITYALTVFVLFSIIFNFLESESMTEEPISENPPCQKDTVNILIAVNWTGSVVNVGNSYKNNDIHYRTQLRTLVKDSLINLIGNIKKQNEVNITYLFFGLKKPKNSSEPNPDFKSNYIKIFKSNCNQFINEDWQTFISNLKADNIGYHTALTVAKELSIIHSSAATKRKFSEYSLILISDGFYNVTGRAGISGEMNELKVWSSMPERKKHEEIKNIEYAGEQATLFNKYYVLGFLKNIHILPDPMKNEDNHFRIEAYEIIPSPKQIPENFIEYSKSLYYEYSSKNKTKIPLNIKLRINNINDAHYEVETINFSILDSFNHCKFQFSYQDGKIPSYLFIPKSLDSFYLKAQINYNYDDEGIYKNYQETHEILIPCFHTKKGKLFWFWQVGGRLMQLHNSIKIFKGEVSIAMFWNIVFLLTSFFWIFLILEPKVTPPIPLVNFELVKEREE